ncbi:hypothetical protein DERF_012103 [Dermatophagoides farinae]|uniref:Uncharacterized protein n=1 Tax=Dermatophagoides farinae TaxID=6954 RepID=A0A922L1E2_DERFA|nr:hypothetical protein DERF_012103 [Dermatophagoides farinae]
MSYCPTKSSTYSTTVLDHKTICVNCCCCCFDSNDIVEKQYQKIRRCTHNFICKIIISFYSKFGIHNLLCFNNVHDVHKAIS